MQVILREDVPNLGRTGEMVTVRDGYGRNFLIPRGLAVVATSRNMNRLEHDRRVIEQRERKLAASADSIKQQIEKASVTIAKQVGADEKLFGSVTTREIVEALKGQSLDVDRKSIQLDEPIRSLGVHEVQIRLRRGASATLKVWVVAAE